MYAPRRSPIDRILLGVVIVLAILVLLLLIERALPRPAQSAAATLPTARVSAPAENDGQVTVADHRIPTPLPWPLSIIFPVPATPAPTPELAAEPAATITPIPLNEAAAVVPAAQAAPMPEVPLDHNAPILMYHYIRSVDQASDPLGFSLSVTPDMFGQQMDWLAANGFTGIRMDRLLACMQGAARCPPRPVALTFDDGYDNAFSDALPILQRYGFTATFYIINNDVGQPAYMTWAQINALHDAGMEIGSHTLDHPDLTSLDPAELKRQIADSKTDLEAHVGVPVTSFCYPAGRYNATTIAQVRDAGFLNATTTRWDNDYSDPFALPRVRISGEMQLDSFAGAVGGS